MATKVDKLVSEIRSLSNDDKIRILDALLTDLDQPDPKVDAMWAAEARRRWQAYKRGELASISYEELISQYSSK
jgi:putative addiction module component (TIGR02574 family)